MIKTRRNKLDSLNSLKIFVILRRSLICVLVLFVLASTVLSISRCDYNEPLRTRMLQYYSDNTNYEERNGRVRFVKYTDTFDEVYICLLVDRENLPNVYLDIEVF